VDTVHKKHQIKWHPKFCTEFWKEVQKTRLKKMHGRIISEKPQKMLVHVKGRCLYPYSKLNLQEENSLFQVFYLC
jgi:hypothetical protein